MTNRSNTRASSWCISRSPAAARAPAAVILLSGLLGAYAPRAWADEEPSDLRQAPTEERFAIHGQVTYVAQETNAFNAPYRGQNSLTPSNGSEA